MRVFLDLFQRLGVSVVFLSSLEIGKKSVPVGMEDAVIELYDLDKAMVVYLKLQKIYKKDDNSVATPEENSYIP